MNGWSALSAAVAIQLGPISTLVAEMARPVALAAAPTALLWRVRRWIIVCATMCHTATFLMMNPSPTFKCSRRIFRPSWARALNMMCLHSNSSSLRTASPTILQIRTIMSSDWSALAPFGTSSRWNSSAKTTPDRKLFASSGAWATCTSLHSGCGLKTPQLAKLFVMAPALMEPDRMTRDSSRLSMSNHMRLPSNSPPTAKFASLPSTTLPLCTQG
mmetsp:Transcript_26232/g.61297  ORF Transcript_26232/g.61297 Transcript_26232/m.61297 type:complete len:216 (-) Transcript_26232:5014-5661(-)